MLEIKINELYPHPQNPRKDVGDVSELADSIKNQGIFQNLTVIKGGAGVPEGVEGYTVIIGHRRLAASKLAGIETVPCSIVEMDEKQQVATMLLENMQRTDLTIYEQAQGFQMMLDLGETQQSIAEKTGFSQTTVHRRLELAKLDQKKLQEASSRQISIADLDKLSQVESIEKRNELLGYIGTTSFEYSVKSAIDAEKRKEKENKWRSVLLDAGLIEIEDRWDNRYTSCIRSCFSCDSDTKDFVRADDEKYFQIHWGWIYLRQDRVIDEDDDKKKAEEQKQREKRQFIRNQFQELTQRAYELRKEFVGGISTSCIKKHIAKIVAFWMFDEFEDSEYLDDEDVAGVLQLNWHSRDFDDEPLTIQEVFCIVKDHPEKYLWEMILLYFGDDSTNGYVDSWDIVHKENVRLTAFYELLIEMGYQMSDEEKQLQDGTHELFKQITE